MELSIVIPFLDEESALGPLLDELRLVLERPPFMTDRTEPEAAPRTPDPTASLIPGAAGEPLLLEVVAVDDGSRDKTGALLEERARTWPVLRVVRHQRRGGQTAALLSGFTAARGRLIATLDGDGQSDPADLPVLLAALGDCHMVTGIRRERRDSWVRRVSSRIAFRVRDAVLHDGIVDTGCSTRLFRRACLQYLPLQFRGMHRFLPALFQIAGYGVKQVPVNHRPRLGGRAKYGIGNRMIPGLVDLCVVRWMKSRYAPPPGEPR